MDSRFKRILKHGIILLLLIHATGCISNTLPGNVRSERAATGSIREVDFRRTPEMSIYAERAREIGNEVYPRIAALLWDDPAEAPQEVDVRFKRRFFLNRGSSGNLTLAKVPAGGSVVYFSAEALNRFEKNSTEKLPEDFGAVFEEALIHELAHVGQKYPGLVNLKQRHWVEGVADYIRYKVDADSEWRCPECSARFVHYTSGYTCAGAFLLFVDEQFGEQVIRRMNAELRNGTFTDAFFEIATGKTLETLWAEFRARDEFKPIAADLYDLQKALGYVNDRPPCAVDSRLRKHIKSHPNAVEIRKWFGRTTVDGKSVALDPPELSSPRIRGDSLLRVRRPIPIEQQLLMFLYFAQPGGSAEQYFEEWLTGPGSGDFQENDSITLSFSFNVHELAAAIYANSRTITIRRGDDPSEYTIVRDFPGGEWRVGR